MRLNLRGVGVGNQPQAVDKRRGAGRPVDVGVGADMGIVIAHRTIDFAEQGDRGNLLYLALKSVSDVCKLFTNGGWRGRLTVSSRQHSHPRILVT